MSNRPIRSDKVTGFLMVAAAFCFLAWIVRVEPNTFAALAVCALLGWGAGLLAINGDFRS